ncbi:diguanylate cyclase domain-containing protein [Blautia sp. MSJ-9]|uniref:diguanylate cyclase domain-containing protein n=1 Tax=Blautia sp. MSJ-9 TaxID=2841511 RepID=UPI001C10B4ED|nr:diguanylate cyclase [Blautia sp. MSJ-9]
MGTAYGDQIIRGVAECIRASLRTGEQVYRIIGDEYLVFLRTLRALSFCRDIIKSNCEAVIRL